MKNIKLSLLILLFSGVFSVAYSQEKEEHHEKKEIIADKKDDSASEKEKLPKPYNPKENAEEKLEKLKEQAHEENKNIILQAGGNWCIWCLRFNHFVQNDPNIKKMIEENFVYYHLNFSPENKNENVFEKYGNPGEKYGYPVLLVLDKEGNLLHTQETSELEEDKGYSGEKITEFLAKWLPNK